MDFLSLLPDPLAQFPRSEPHPDQFQLERGFVDVRFVPLLLLLLLLLFVVPTLPKVT